MTKAAFIDVDGTLTNGKSSWEKAHHHFQVTDQMKKHSQRFFSGQISYDEWAQLDVGLWKGKPITDLHKALNPPNLVDGAKEGVKKLQDAGYDVILVSGGINTMVDEVKRLTGADDAFSNIIGATDGVIDGSLHLTVGIKTKIIKQLKDERNYDMENSIAIGDHVNDIEMFEYVGTSFAVNPKSEQLIEVADEVIETDDFRYVVQKVLGQ